MDEFIKKTLAEASKIATEKFGNVTSSVKEFDHNQVLTEADLSIGQFIISEVSIAFPEHNIIDEEAGVINNNSEYTWVVDPIDGTSNFANGLPFYGIMLGLLKGDEPFAGGIALPYFNEIYTAERGKGAYCNGQKISVSQETELSNILVAFGHDGHPENPELSLEQMTIYAEVADRVRNLRSTNSVYDSAMVASGKMGALLVRSGKIWDNVAQQIIIEEAGGKYTDFWGEPTLYTNPLERTDIDYTICAASPTLHLKMQEIIQKYKKDV